MLKLSVVFSTFNRCETIKTSLRCLAEQDIGTDVFEVIVVDDGSPDRTTEVVAELKEELPLQMSYMRHENHGPGYTQNQGLKVAKAPLVLLMADDIWLAPWALRAHLELHEKNPEPGVAVLGKVLQSEKLSGSVFLQHMDPFGFQDLVGRKELGWHMFWGCNISVKRAFLEEHGVFREHRGRGGAPAHEDVELGYRLKEHGLRILFSEEASGTHYHPYTLERAINRYYERGLNWGELKRFIPGPEIDVINHALTLKTLPEYARYLRGPNPLEGKEGSLGFQLLRHLVFVTAFNPLTEPLFWRPLIDKAESSPRIARLMSRQLYRAYLYYHFLRGVRAGEQDASGEAAQSHEAA